MDSTTSIHRRIELQSSDDLNYLIANAKRAARARIDALYPLPTNQPSTDTANPSSAPRERGRDEHACEADGAEEEAILRERKKIEEEVDAVSLLVFLSPIVNWQFENPSHTLWFGLYTISNSRPYYIFIYSIWISSGAADMAVYPCLADCCYWLHAGGSGRHGMILILTRFLARPGPIAHGSPILSTFPGVGQSTLMRPYSKLTISERKHHQLTRLKITVHNANLHLRSSKS